MARLKPLHRTKTARRSDGEDEDEAWQWSYGGWLVSGDWDVVADVAMVAEEKAKNIGERWVYLAKCYNFA